MEARREERMKNKKEKKPKKLKFESAYDIITQVGHQEFEIPWHAWTFFSDSGKKSLSIFGDQVSIGDGDYKTLAEARESVEWLITQLGGTVKWR